MLYSISKKEKVTLFVEAMLHRISRTMRLYYANLI